MRERKKTNKNNCNNYNNFYLLNDKTFFKNLA